MAARRATNIPLKPYTLHDTYELPLPKNHMKYARLKMNNEHIPISTGTNFTAIVYNNLPVVRQAQIPPQKNNGAYAKIIGIGPERIQTQLRRSDAYTLATPYG